MGATPRTSDPGLRRRATSSPTLRAIFIAGALLTAGPSAAAPIVVTLSTAQSQFTPGINNQGWWSDTRANGSSNIVIAVGFDAFSPSAPDKPAAEIRNFFTFDLNDPALAGAEVASAVLRTTRNSSFGLDATETIGFFDVSTAPSVLNANSGTSASIFDDLGTGTSYGSFGFPGSGARGDVISFELNAAAVADINAALGSFFSIGGRLLSLRGNETTELAFTEEPLGVPQLVLTLVPEPGTVLLLAVGLGIVALRQRR